MGTVEPGTNGSQVALQLRAGLGIRHFTEITQNHHFAIVHRQGLNGFADQIDGLALQDVGDGVVATLQRKLDLLSLLVLGDQRCAAGLRTIGAADKVAGNAE